MKLAFRILALSLVFAGVSAASVSSSPTRALPSHQAVTSSVPIPTCAPGLPGCPELPTGK